MARQGIQEYFNANDNEFEIGYRTASQYFGSTNDAKRSQLTTYTSDFFPLNENGVWSGYFTSRPFLKQQIRYTGRLLNSVFKLGSFV